MNNTNDSFTNISNIQPAILVTQTTTSNNNDDSLITEIGNQLNENQGKEETKVFSAAPEKDFKITALKLSKIDTKLTK